MKRESQTTKARVIDRLTSDVTSDFKSLYSIALELLKACFHLMFVILIPNSWSSHWFSGPINRRHKKRNKLEAWSTLQAKNCFNNNRPRQYVLHRLNASYKYGNGLSDGYYESIAKNMNLSVILFNNYSSSPNGLWFNRPWGRRPNGLLTQTIASGYSFSCFQGPCRLWTYLFLLLYTWRSTLALPPLSLLRFVSLNFGLPFSGLCSQDFFVFSWLRAKEVSLCLSENL